MRQPSEGTYEKSKQKITMNQLAKIKLQHRIQIEQLLTESLQIRDIPTASMCLELLLRLPHAPSIPFFWQTFMEIKRHQHHSLPSRTHYFLKLLSAIVHKDNLRVEWLLELALDHIANDDVSGAFEHLLQRVDRLNHPQTAILYGYMGMIKYAEWCRGKEDGKEESGECASSRMNALQYFEKGTMEGFVPYYVELLVAEGTRFISPPSSDVIDEKARLDGLKAGEMTRNREVSAISEFADCTVPFY